MADDYVTVAIRMSPEARRALKRAGIEYDADLQTVVRALARQLDDGTLHGLQITDADRGRKTGPKPAGI